MEYKIRILSTQKGNEMKITKTSDRAYFLKMAEQNANKGCDKCPCCGKPCDNTLALAKTWYEGGLFKKGRHMKVKCYSCSSCGAEWESDPYEWV